VVVVTAVSPGVKFGGAVMLLELEEQAATMVPATSSHAGPNGARNLRCVTDPLRLGLLAIV